MKGIELCARFAIPPNSLSYCGKEGFGKVFEEYLENPCEKTENALEQALCSFTAHYSYLELIANANKMKPFDYGVCEAFWLGNKLLNKVKRREIARMIQEKFVGKGMLAKEKATELAKAVPKEAVPHHSFHALYLHSITGVIAPTVKNADSCRIAWGKVLEAGDNWVEIKSQRLAEKNAKLRLEACSKRVKLSCSGIGLLQKIKKGDFVACHWGIAAMKISFSQAKRLEKATCKNVEAVNSV